MTDHELSKARALVRDLQRVEIRNDGDRRFLESWHHYRDRTGDAARRVGGASSSANEKRYYSV